MINTDELNSHGLYPLPLKFCNSGENFRMWAFADVNFVPTYHQWRLYSAIDLALNAGLFYTSDILDFVAKEVADIVTPEMRAKNSSTSPVEGGYFGYEVYSMTHVVKKHRTARANKEALKVLESNHQLAPGKKLKGPFAWGSKTYSSLAVQCINRAEGILSVIGTIRGSKNKYQFSVGAGCDKLMALFADASSL